MFVDHCTKYQNMHGTGITIICQFCLQFVVKSDAGFYFLRYSRIKFLWIDVEIRVFGNYIKLDHIIWRNKSIFRVQSITCM